MVLYSAIQADYYLFKIASCQRSRSQAFHFCNNAYRIAKETGIDKTYLSKLSSGAIAKPGAEKLDKIAQALGIESKKLSTVFTNPEIAVREFDLAGIDLQQPVINRRRDWGAAPDGIVC